MKTRNHLKSVCGYIVLNIFGVLLPMMLIAASCSCSSESEKERPLSKVEALSLAGSEKLTDAPDTIFLDYHWYMSPKEVKNLTAKYIREKKLKKQWWGDGYDYKMTLKNSEDITSSVYFSYYHDSLYMVSIFDDGYNPVSALYDTFSDIFLSKGYKDYYEDFDIKFLQSTNTMIKNNTSITFVKLRGHACMALKNEYLGQKNEREQKAKREAEEAEKRMKQKEKQRSTQNDF